MEETRASYLVREERAKHERCIEQSKHLRRSPTQSGRLVVKGVRDGPILMCADDDHAFFLGSRAADFDNLSKN